MEVAVTQLRKVKWKLEAQPSHGQDSGVQKQVRDALGEG